MAANGWSTMRPIEVPDDRRMDVLDAFFFIDLLVSSPDWKVVKFDIEK